MKAIYMCVCACARVKGLPPSHYDVQVAISAYQKAEYSFRWLWVTRDEQWRC